MAPETQTETSQPSGPIGTFGLKTDVFIAQLINFLIILFVLWKWAYKPLLRIMDERQKKIERGLQDAADAQRKLAGVDAERLDVLKQAREDGAVAIRDAHASAEKKREELLAKAREEISHLVRDARSQIAQERAQAQEELKKEIAALVVSTAELVLKEKIDASHDATLMEKAVKKAKAKKV